MRSTLCSRLFVAIVAVLSLSSGASAGRCDLKLDRGTPCIGPEAGIKYYHDAATGICLAFRYQGCGGNGNRFNTIHDCNSNCRGADGGNACALNKPAAKDKSGKEITCLTTQAGPGKCPPGYQCRNSAFSGKCCPKKEEDLFSKNYEGKCRSGATVKEDRGGYEATVLGKSCDHFFCPADSSCEQGEIFAHCCRH